MACPPHPYGVRPGGQAFLEGSEFPDIRPRGLGRLARLSDELLLGVLYELPPAALQRLAMASRALYAFCHYDELWKAHALERIEGGIQSWHGTWRATFLVHATAGASPPAKRYDPASHRPLDCRGLYSDLLHRPWLCATMEMPPEWLEVETVDRRAGLSVEEFEARYERPNVPVILTDVAAAWPARTKWTRAYLLQAFAGRAVIVGNAPMRLAPYLAYADANADEMPLYLFDKAFALAAPQLAADYSVPPHFADDLFAALGDEARPDHRWLIVGPKGSGSSFHVDPNATSAWNAVVRGAKKWLLYPPGVTPPGVHVSADGAEVAAPVSLMEWFLNFYDEARNGGDSDDDGSSDDGGGGGGGAGGKEQQQQQQPQGRGRSRSRRRRARPLECVVRAGELLYVPRGWFHTVVNLEDSVAVTHNFVSRANLDAVLAFLEAGARVPGLVSGCDHREDLHRRFVAALKARRPEVWAEYEARQAARRAKREEEGRLAGLFREAAAAQQTKQQQQQQQQQQQTKQQRQQETDSKGAAVECSGNGDAAADGGGGGFTFGFSL